MNFKQQLLLAQSGDKRAQEELLEQYRPLLVRESIHQGVCGFVKSRESITSSSSIIEVSYIIGCGSVLLVINYQIREEGRESERKMEVKQFDFLRQSLPEFLYSLNYGAASCENFLSVTS